MENNNIEDGDVCIVASQAIKKRGEHSSPLVVTTAKMLLTQGEKISYMQIEAEDSNTATTSQEVSNDELIYTSSSFSCQALQQHSAECLDGDWITATL